jgi:hypothetical protein
MKFLNCFLLLWAIFSSWILIGIRITNTDPGTRIRIYNIDFDWVHYLPTLPKIIGQIREILASSVIAKYHIFGIDMPKQRNPH